MAWPLKARCCTQPIHPLIDHMTRRCLLGVAGKNYHNVMGVDVLQLVS